MTGREFIRRLRKLARKQGVTVTIETGGKGDHIKLYFGTRRTVVPDLGELKTGTFRAMCKQLGIKPRDL